MSRQKRVVHMSVSKICQYYYPYRERPSRERLEEGLKAEERTKRKIDYTYYQLEMEAELHFEDFVVKLYGTADFVLVDDGRVTIYEKKDYYLNRRCLERVRLQLSLYALLYSENYGIEYEDIKVVALGKDDVELKIKKIPLPELIRKIKQYAKAKLLLLEALNDE